MPTPPPPAEEGPRLCAAMVQAPLGNPSSLIRDNNSFGTGRVYEPTHKGQHKWNRQKSEGMTDEMDIDDNPKIGIEVEVEPDIWEVPPVLANVPPHYPLASGYCTIFVPRISSSVVAQRISRCLRDQSIQAHYDGKQATAECCTMGMVEFLVSLFAGRKEFSHGVIVEVRRLKGCSLAFYRARCAVTLSAEGKEVTEELVTQCSEKLQLLDMEISLEDEILFANSTFDDAMNLIREEREDAQLLGIESLVNLTDPEKSGKGIAKRASARLLKQDEAQYVKHVNDFIWNKEKQLNEYDEQHYNHMRYGSLVLISNAVSAVGELGMDSLWEGSNKCVIEELNELVSVLVRELEEALKRPHGAYFAAKVLNSLINNWPSVNVLGQIEFDVLLEANKAGLRCHARLENESDTLLALLKNKA